MSRIYIGWAVFWWAEYVPNVNVRWLITHADDLVAIVHTGCQCEMIGCEYGKWLLCNAKEGMWQTHDLAEQKKENVSINEGWIRIDAVINNFQPHTGLWLCKEFSDDELRTTVRWNAEGHIYCTSESSIDSQSGVGKVIKEGNERMWGNIIKKSQCSATCGLVAVGVNQWCRQNMRNHTDEISTYLLHVYEKLESVESIGWLGAGIFTILGSILHKEVLRDCTT